MSYLHNCLIVHRDLKSANLLCTATYACKVSDFGESRKLDSIQFIGVDPLLLNPGTSFWVAPEILREESYDAMVDCYSFGIMMIEFETRQNPYYDYENFSTVDIMTKIAAGELRPRIPHSCLPERRSLIEACLEQDPHLLKYFIVYNIMCVTKS